MYMQEIRRPQLDQPFFMLKSECCDSYLLYCLDHPFRQNVKSLTDWREKQIKRKPRIYCYCGSWV